MKPHIVSDGATRLRNSPEFQARLRELRETIQARHAAEFEAAGFFRRQVLRWRMVVEFRAERRKIEPSAGSLVSNKVDRSASADNPRILQPESNTRFAFMRSHKV